MTQPLYHVDFSVLLGLRWWFVLRLSKWNQIFPHKPHTVVNSGLNLQYSRAVTFQEWLLFILHNKLGILKYAEKHSVPVQLSELLQQHISTNLDQSLVYEPSVLFLTQRELFIFSLFIVFFFFSLSSFTARFYMTWIWFRSAFLFQVWVEHTADFLLAFLLLLVLNIPLL